MISREPNAVHIMRSRDRPPRTSWPVVAFAMTWLCVGIALATMRAIHPGLEIGVMWNDAHVLCASAWFERHGFAPTHGLPIWGGSEVWPGDQPEIYGTFPPGVFYVHEGLKLLGLRALWQFRVASVVWSQAGAWMMFLVARRLSGSAVIGAVAGVLYMLSAPYTTYAGGLWEPLPMLTLLGTIYCWLRLETAESSRIRKAWLLATLLACLLDSMMTLQHGAMIAVVLVARSLWRDRSWRRLGAALSVAATAPLVMAVRFLVLVDLIGRSRAWEYLSVKATQRAGMESETFTRSHALLVSVDRLGLRDGLAGPASPGAFEVSSLVQLALCVPAIGLLVYRRRDPCLERARRAVTAGLLLLAGAMTWPLLMPQHASIHQFVGLMLLPGATLAAAGLAIVPFALERGAVRGAVRWGLIGASVAFVGMTLRDARRSELLSAYVNLHHPTRRRVLQFEEDQSLLRQASQHLTGVERLVVTSWTCRTGFHLDPGCGFIWNPPARMPTGLHRAECWAIELSERNGLVRSVPLPERAPQMIARPASVAVVWDPSRPDDPGVHRAQSDDGVCGLCWAQTLDGSCRALALTVRRDLDDGDMRATKVWCAAFDSDGSVLFERATTMSDSGIRLADGAIAWMEVPLNLGAGAVRITLRLDGPGLVETLEVGTEDPRSRGPTP